MHPRFVFLFPLLFALISAVPGPPGSSGAPKPPDPPIPPKPPIPPQNKLQGGASSRIPLSEEKENIATQQAPDILTGGSGSSGGGSPRGGSSGDGSSGSRLRSLVTQKVVDVHKELESTLLGQEQKNYEALDSKREEEIANMVKQLREKKAAEEKAVREKANQRVAGQETKTPRALQKPKNQEDSRGTHQTIASQALGVKLRTPKPSPESELPLVTPKKEVMAFKLRPTPKPSPESELPLVTPKKEVMAFKLRPTPNPSPKLEQPPVIQAGNLPFLPLLPVKPSEKNASPLRPTEEKGEEKISALTTLRDKTPVPKPRIPASANLPILPKVSSGDNVGAIKPGRMLPIIEKSSGVPMKRDAGPLTPTKRDAGLLTPTGHDVKPLPPTGRDVRPSPPARRNVRPSPPVEEESELAKLFAARKARNLPTK